MKRASIVLPTYNERENLTRSIACVLAEEKNAPGWQFEIVVVDSCSPDGTMELAEVLAAQDERIHTLSVDRGLGRALIEGHRYAIRNLKPDALAQIDADGQVTCDVLPRLLQAVDEGYELAIGSRFVRGGKNELPFIRRVLTWGACTICRYVMGPADIREFTNSARAFAPTLFERMDFSRLPWREGTYVILPAFLNEAVLAGARYKEVPLVFRNRDDGFSKNKVIGYVCDIIAYTIDARLHKWGWNVPFFSFTRRGKKLLRTSLVRVRGVNVAN